jgi:hypothetical protein
MAVRGIRSTIVHQPQALQYRQSGVPHIHGAPFLQMTAGIFSSRIVPLKSSKSAGRALTILPAHRLFDETGTSSGNH